MGSQKRGAAWTGVSSKKQAEAISPQEQMRLIREHAARWDIEIVAELEVAESRSIILFEEAARRIPAYAQLADMISRRAIDVLFCYDVGRLGRKRALTLAIIDLCVEAGIRVYEIESPPRSLDEDYDYADLIIHAIEATGYEYEVTKLKERLAYGRMGRVKAGNLPGRAPYGYRLVVVMQGLQMVRRVEVNETTAPVVREIFRRYLAGESMGRISASLNERGIPAAAGGRWTHVIMGQLLRRVWRYAGYGEITVTNKKGRHYIKAPGNWEPLIDAATADRIISERAARKDNRRIADTKSRLSGVVWCDLCQRPMNQSLPATEHNGRPRHVRFYCKNPQHKNAVPTRRILAALRVALDTLAGSDLSAIEDAPSDAIDVLRDRIAEHESAIKRRRRDMLQAQTLAVDGLLSADELRHQLERVRAAIAAEQQTIERLRGQMDAEQARGTRRERLAHVIARGYEMLTTDDTAVANVWWREYARVWCNDNNIIEVRLG